MKGSTRVIFIIMTVIMLTACKSATLDEAIKEQIPFNVEQVIHTEIIKDGAIVLYTTNQQNEFKSFLALTVAYMKGNNKQGWENVGHNHWEYGENQNMTTHFDEFYNYDKKGKLLKKISVLYGEINNTQIKEVELSNQTQVLTKADILTINNKRYYFKLGTYGVVRGLGTGGEVIEEYKQN
ncbi:hypothetical protein ACFYKX_18435 [Cytobacillus sp. FJAT-54145]|uniref:Lipoprotein n=1 Tax=Cytobacillus spartinae TaxID=3299023 RepID=A0ABW6KE94_9BACI